MRATLQSAWTELTASGRRTLALTLGPALLLLAAQVMDSFTQDPDARGMWGMLTFLPATAWLSVNWLTAPPAGEQPPERMPVPGIRPLLRSMVLVFLLSALAFVVALPFVAARIYLSTPPDTLQIALWPLTLMNWLASAAMGLATVWFWLRLAPSFAAVASGGPFGLRQALGATRPQAQVILWLTLVVYIVFWLADQAAKLPSQPIAGWLGTVTTALFVLWMVILCRTIALRSHTPHRAEIFA